jgi:hypothetical protein
MYFCFYECGEERHSANAFYGQGVGLTKRSIFTFIPYVVGVQRQSPSQQSFGGGVGNNKQKVISKLIMSTLINF